MNEVSINPYGIYDGLVSTHRFLISVDAINKNNWNEHFNSILNIIRDYVEDKEIMESFITVQFPTIAVDFTVTDYFFNLIMWYLIITTDNIIEPKHIFFEEAITRKSIKQYIDTYFLDINRTRLDNILLNNIIDDCLYNFNYIDEFSLYLANTVCLEDDIYLMQKNQRVNEILHSDLSNVPITELKKTSADLTTELIKYITSDDSHCLKDYFKAGECINKKQYTECNVNIGGKPIGDGKVSESIINTSYAMGGLYEYMDYRIESSASRLAQIIIEDNVGDSGYFSRTLGLNNLDSYINKDPHYSCNTKNFIHVTIEDAEMLSKFEGRYYKLVENGIDFKITKNSTDLIGKHILLRSPMTCASGARGEGICYKCYGDLAYTTKMINIGKIAAEIISSYITQKMLSAKHLLEIDIKKLKWNPEFYKYFEVSFNCIKLLEMDFKGYKLKIDKNSLISEDDESKEHTSVFTLILPNKTEVDIYTEDMDNLYTTIDLVKAGEEFGIIDDDQFIVPLETLRDIPLFMMDVHNNDLTKVLDNCKAYIDNTTKIKDSGDMHTLLYNLNNSLKNAGIYVSSVHSEIILSNQIKAADNILETPQWEYPNEPYQILTLKQAIKKSAPVTVGLAFERYKEFLANPSTYAKKKTSIIDLFFMKQPHLYLYDDNLYEKEEKYSNQLVKFNKDLTNNE